MALHPGPQRSASVQATHLIFGNPLDLSRSLHFDINYLCDFIAAFPLPACPLRDGDA